MKPPKEIILFLYVYLSAAVMGPGKSFSSASHVSPHDSLAKYWLLRGLKQSRKIYGSKKY